MSMKLCTHSMDEHPPGFCPNTRQSQTLFIAPGSLQVTSRYEGSSQLTPPPGFSSKAVSSVLNQRQNLDDATPKGLARRLLRIDGKKSLTSVDSRDLCKMISDRRVGFDRMLSLIKEVNITGSHHILSAIFSKDFSREPRKEYIRIFQRELFDLMPKHLRNISILNQYMNLAGSSGEFNLLDQLLEEAGDSADSYTYATCLKYGKKFPEKAHFLFQKAQERGFDNIVVINTYMDIVKNNPRYFSELQKIFAAATLRLDVQSQTCAIFIRACVEMRQFEEGEKAFSFAKKRGLANQYVIGEYLRLCYIDLKWEKAALAFSLLEKVETIPYVNYLVIAGKCGRLDEARRVFQILQKYNKADAYAYVKFLEILKKIGTFEEMDLVYKEASKNPRLLSDELLYIYYRGAVHYGQSEKARLLIENLPVSFTNRLVLFQQQSFEEAPAEEFYYNWCTANFLGHANVELDQHTIAFLSNRHRLDLVGKVFHEALEKGRANSKTCGYYLKCIKLHKAWDLADEIFHLIKQRNMMNEQIIAIYVEILRKQDRKEELNHLYNEHISNPSKTHIALFANYINLLCKSGEVEKARALVATRPTPEFILQSDGMLGLDLHHQSLWSGYLELLRYTEQENCLPAFQVICGQGSDEWGNYLHLSTFLLEQFENSSLARVWNLRAHPKNPGALICERKDPLPQLQ